MKYAKPIFTFVFSHRWLVWSPLLFLLPVYLLTYFNVVGLRHAFRDQNELALTSAARRLSERVDNFVKSNREAIGTEAQIVTLADALLGIADYREVKEVLRNLAAKNELYVTSYALLNRDGRNIVDTNATFAGRDESAASYFQIPRLSNRVFAGGMRFVADGGAYVVFSAPVRDREGGVIGVLRSQYSGAVLQMITSSAYGLMGRGSYGVLIDKKSGLVIGHGRDPDLVFSPTRQVQPTIQDELLASGVAPRRQGKGRVQWLAEFAEPGGSSNYLAVTPAGGSELLGAAVDCAYSGWQVVYLQPAEVLKKAFQEQLLSTLLLALVTALLVLGLSLGVSQLLQRLKKREVDLVRANQKVKVSLFREQQFNHSLARNLELGRSVQNSLHQLPRLPTNVDVVVHHEAAKFVSGDTFFVHWNRPEHSATVILNDVTGHGVQAALKAAACQQIARSVWSAGMGSVGRIKGQKLMDYDRQVEAFLASIGDDIPDFNAMVGAEVDLHTGRVALFRANYNFPVVLVPHMQGDSFQSWQINARVLNNREVVYQQLEPGSFVILMSDGFIDQPRHQHRILKMLSAELQHTGKTLTAQQVRRLLLNWEANTVHSHADDKTFIVLHWRGVYGQHTLTG